MSFYDQVLRELLAAIGGALFVGNLLALVRRRREITAAPEGAAADLDHAPIGRTVLYLVIGFVVMVWGIASFVVA